MKNPFLTLLEDPASLIIVEFDNAEKEMIVRMLKEKVNNAIAEYQNPEQHPEMYEPFNKWLYYLNEMWDGKLNYSFEQQCNNVGLELHEVYGIIIDIMTTKHLDTLCRLDELEYKNNTTHNWILRMMDEDDDME